MINIKDYLYHGISDYNIKMEYQNNGLYTLEEILKSHSLKRLDTLRNESTKLDDLSICNIYTPDQGFSSRVSLGYYPDDDYLYYLSKGEYIHFKSIEEALRKVNVNIRDLDNLIQTDRFHKYDFAFGTYYNNITLLLDKTILDDYTPSIGFMVDEICITDDIKIDNYLKYIGVSNRISSDELTNKIYKLIDEYGYDVEVIKFPSGESVNKEKTLTKII